MLPKGGVLTCGRMSQVRALVCKEVAAVEVVFLRTAAVAAIDLFLAPSILPFQDWI